MTRNDTKNAVVSDLRDAMSELESLRGELECRDDVVPAEWEVAHTRLRHIVQMLNRDLEMIGAATWRRWA